MCSYESYSPVWIRVGRSSSIRNWLNVIPYGSVIVEIRWIPPVMWSILVSIAAPFDARCCAATYTSLHSDVQQFLNDQKVRAEATRRAAGGDETADRRSRDRAPPHEGTCTDDAERHSAPCGRPAAHALPPLSGRTRDRTRLLRPVHGAEPAAGWNELADD